MKWKDKIQQLSNKVDEKFAKLTPIWVELANKYPLEEIPMHLKDTTENRQWQVAMLNYQNHVFYMKNHNINPDDEISTASSMNGRTILEYMGGRHGLQENWWISGSKQGFSLNYVLQDSPIEGREGMQECYTWGFDSIGEAIRVRNNLTESLNEGRDVKTYGENNELNEEQLLEKYGNNRIYLNVKFQPFNN